MAFKHAAPLDLVNLASETTENGRFYTTPEGNKYPSVTTVIGAASDKTWLKEWKDRVGEDEAKKILVQAGKRGTAVHELAEQYLLNNHAYKKGHMPANIASFAELRPFLDEHVEEVIGLELPLYSDFLRIAGRSDCIAIWDGKVSIVDFKTSKRSKSKEDIPDYFIQTSLYAYMFYERTGIPVTQLIILMTIDDDTPKMFIENTKDWIKKAIELRNSVDL